MAMLISNREKLPITLSAFLFSILFWSHTFNCQQQERHQQAISDEFHEDLYLTPLPDGKLFAHFQFKTLYRKDIKSLRWENKIEIFPLSVVDLVATTDLQELHFSLTKGNWNYKDWGYPVRSSPPGAQIQAKFSQHNENLNRSWRRLVNSLAGKFCASLMSADHTVLVEPKLSLTSQFSQATGSSSNLSSSNDAPGLGPGGRQTNSERFLYSNLPEEILCTQNLTPWKKLLPCYSNSGIASLLNAVNLLKSSHSSLSIDMEPKKCVDEDGDPIDGCDQVQLTQSISVVFNPLLQFEGRQSWSLAKIFGNKLQRQCQLASHSEIHVDISDPSQRDKFYPQGYRVYSLRLNSGLVKQYAAFNLSSILSGGDLPGNSFNTGVKQDRLFKRQAYSSRQSVPISLRTHIAGLGTADGTIVATVSSSLNDPIRVTYMDAIPYFMRVYLHTLTIRTSSGQELKPNKLNFVLSQEETPTLIEFSFIIPANSEVQISYDFERAFLAHNKFKPGANRGTLLGSSMIIVPIRPLLNHLVMPLCTRFGRLSVAGSVTDTSSNTTTVQLIGLDDNVLRIYSKPLLVILPMPDFSMPYNVLCLVTTVLVSAFGPIYNMTTRKPVIQITKQSKKQQRSDVVEEEYEVEKKNE
uniref:GPI transamidase component PIG-T n=1 Tax=Aceria tosichella TaxID=561515 RepID=A0A6G1SC30_9ACAR